jgi:hypothetical protein
METKLLLQNSGDYDTASEERYKQRLTETRNLLSSRDKWGHPNPPPEHAKVPAIINPRSNTLIIYAKGPTQYFLQRRQKCKCKYKGGEENNTERNRINASIQQ